MSDWFDELQQDRWNWVQSTRKNQFEQGIYRSAVEKYADPAHFVYELLQNAEDQGATEASFVLRRARLIFEHNGGPFTRQDVVNITGIGNTQKPEESNKIGRFGIGFKSVFTITERPEIYSILDGGPMAFAIEDLVVPRRVAYERAASGSGTTRFVLPFRPGGEEGTYAIVDERLRTLGADTLLFLNKLVAVSWKTEEQEGDYLCERECRTGECTLIGECGPRGGLKEREERSYLVFAKEISLPHADRSLSAAIAFRTEEGAIVQEQASPALYVYFPTEETTGLKFRLHAPFLLTDNRANLRRGDKTNEPLMAECANLLVDALRQLRDRDLLTAHVLGCLPINEKDFPDGKFVPILEKRTPFRPLFDAVLEALKRESMLPAADGGYVSAQDAKIARGEELMSLLGSVQLEQLYGRPCRWLSADVGETDPPGVRDYVMRCLGVEELRPESFLSKVNDAFMEQQSDEWIIGLYHFLQEHRGIPTVKRRPIIRCEDGTHVEACDYLGKPQVFLPPQGRTQCRIVKRSIAADSEAFEFLDGVLRLQKPDPVDNILASVLPRYGNAIVDVPDDDYILDLEQVFEALQGCPNEKRSGFLARLREARLIKVINAGDQNVSSWRPSGGAYQPTEDLRIWFEGNSEAWFVHPLLSEQAFSNDLLASLDVQAEVRIDYRRPGTDGHVMIQSCWGNHKRGLHGFDPDADVAGLRHAIENVNGARAQILWRLLLGHAHLIWGKVEISRRQTWEEATIEEDFSTLGSPYAYGISWLPDAGGNWRVPHELFLSDLPDGFENDTPRAQELARQLDMKQGDVENLAAKEGVDPSLLRDVLDLLKTNPDRARQLVEQTQKPDFPESASPDPSRRFNAVLAEAAAAPQKTYKVLPRSERVSKAKIHEETKLYLRDLYTNPSEQMICQICEHEMPFRLDNGEYYFECVECVRSLSAEHSQNHLALCPVCAAKYRVANTTPEDEFLKAIRDGDSLCLSLILAQAAQHVRFVEKHLMDLRATLAAEGVLAETAGPAPVRHT